MQAVLNAKDGDGNYRFRNKKVIYFSNNAQVESFLDAAGATEEIFFNTQYALNNSGPTKKMDFAFKVLDGKPASNGFANLSKEEYDVITPFFIKGQNAYNHYDYGNYIWGAAMNRIGHPLWYSKIGAHLNHNIQHREFGTDEDWLDSPWDQKAIEAGWNSQEN